MKILNKLEYIKQLNFFKLLNVEQLNTISHMSSIIKHPRNSVLYYENDRQNKLFFLVSGLLKVYKIDKYENEIFLYYIHENSLISELTSINAIECSSNAAFLEESTILEVDFLQFKQKLLSKNILSNEFINEILAKNHRLHCVINRELIFTAYLKVASLLYDDLEMFNKLKRKEVSFMLHIQPETLSRVLKKLKKESIIDIENSQIVIKNIEALKKYLHNK